MPFLHWDVELHIGANILGHLSYVNSLCCIRIIFLVHLFIRVMIKYYIQFELFLNSPIPLVYKNDLTHVFLYYLIRCQ